MSSSDHLGEQGIHERKIRAVFGAGVSCAGEAQAFDHPLVLLAFSNRSGSNLLAHYLRTTRAFAGFHELLNHEGLLNHAKEWGVSGVADYVKRVSAEYGKPGRIFGFKASWDQILMLLRFEVPRLYDGVRIIHITRQDVIGQAVSYLIAHQTRRWTSLQAADPGASVNYDEALLERLLEETHRSEAMIATLSNAFAIPRLVVTYEGLQAQPGALLKRIGAFTGVDIGPLTLPKPRIGKQADAVNEEFRARFTEHLRRRALAQARIWA
ncbi:Stf0 family sulfotransferase [Ostreiculturibacter nitratireducens]|uniref:Stf0 family sulfotransferase n=1 Tax=Ostreiculturibacter nitratireducens TaxID=3075226 RepID=UPI0031B584B3